MSLVRRSHVTDVDRPLWLSGRFLDWPTTLKDLLEDTDMKVEEFEEDGKLVVRAELPGIDPEKDVEVTVSDHTLHLRAERREETRTEDKRGYRSEFRYGAFSRSVPLPADATDADVSATYRDGILEVRVPMDGGDSGRKIPVERS